MLGICARNMFRPSQLSLAALDPGPHPRGQGRVDPAQAAGTGGTDWKKQQFDHLKGGVRSEVLCVTLDKSP